MGKITVEVKINTFGNMLYSLNHPNIYIFMPHLSSFLIVTKHRIDIIYKFTTLYKDLNVTSNSKCPLCMLQSYFLVLLLVYIRVYNV